VRDETLDWLSSCHGYGVEAGGGRVGVVEDVRYGAEQSVAAALVVPRRRVRRSVVSVSPRSKRVVVRDRS